MTKEELKIKLKELQKDLELDHHDMCDELYGGLYNDGIGEQAQPFINGLLISLLSSDSFLFEEILKLIDQLK